MRSPMIVRTGFAMTLIGLAPGRAEQMNMQTTSDREAILQHIHSIFQAYLRQDREALRRTHTHDWVGFQGPSVEIERGIDAYMVNAEKSLQNLRGVGYELLDTEIQIHGDLALVYYIARYDFEAADGRKGSLPLRSIDVYRHDNGKWNQCGSHITPIPAGGIWGERQEDRSSVGSEGGDPAAAVSPRREGSAPEALGPSDREALLKARETVWRAWFSGDRTALRTAVPEDAIALDLDVADWANREEILRRSSAFAKRATLVRLEFPETRMQVYGDVVVLYTRFLFETENNGKRNVTTGQGTEVFVKREGRWLNTGWHLSESGAEGAADRSRGR